VYDSLEEAVFRLSLASARLSWSACEKKNGKNRHGTQSVAPRKKRKREAIIMRARPKLERFMVMVTLLLGFLCAMALARWRGTMKWIDGRSRMLLGTALLGALLLVSPVALAIPRTYRFAHIVEPWDGPSELANGAVGEAQLFVDVSDFGSNRALFTFRNTGPEPCVIKGIYFDDGALLALAFVVNGPGVSFTQDSISPVSLGELPAGNNLVPPFVTTANFLADADNPSGIGKKGVDPYESVGIVFDLQSGMDFGDVLAFLEDGGLRIGIHVGSFDDTHAETFVNDCLIRVVAPNGGETLVAGATYSISWSYVSYIGDVLIEYSADNGENWNDVDIVSNTGNYDWLVPWVNSNQCLVRVSDANDPYISDTSDAVFTITGSSDLEITSEDITFVPLPGEPCEPVTISATIRNNGLITAENVEVFLKDFDEIIGSQVIPSIAAGDSNTVSIERTWAEAGFHLITVIVDPYDDISESDETNNTASKLYQVGDVGDMNAVIEVSCSAPAGFTEGSTATLRAEAFYRIQIPGVPDYVLPVKGGSVSTTITYAGQDTNLPGSFTDAQGRFNISFAVPGVANDVFDVNIVVTDVTLTGTWQHRFRVWPIIPPPPKKDLWVGEITFGGSGSDVVIEAQVHAKADNSATEPNVPVSFYFHPPQSGTQIGSTRYIAEMEAGDSNTVSIIWSDAPNGLYCIEATIGPAYSDDNNANNTTRRAVAVGPEPSHIDIVIEIPSDINASGTTDVNVLVTDNNGNVMIPCLLETLTLDINGVDERHVDFKPYFDWDALRYVYPWQPPSDANGLGCLNVTAQSVDISGKTITGADSVCADVNDDDPPNFSISASPYWAKIGQSVRITVNASELLLGDEPNSIAVTDSSGGPITFLLTAHDPCTTRWVYETDLLPETTAHGTATISVTGIDLRSNTGYGVGYFSVRGQSDAMPDFWVHSEDIGFSDEEPNLGDTIAIGAMIHADSGNTITGPNIPVTFYARHPAGDYQIGETQHTGQIPPGGSDSVSVLWTNTAEGWYVIEVELGPEFSDRNASNNRATRSLLVGFECGFACDLNCDGTVDFEDIARLAQDWLESGSIADIYPPPPDGDNIVDFLDFARCADNWLRSF
jgi:hypothetical protein